MVLRTDLFKIAAGLLLTVSVHAADTVPTEIQMPGTQPGEVPSFESPGKCANCHEGYNGANTVGDPQHEPVTGWRGGAMGNAGRDAIFWATVAISEQDFDGSGDLCIRCHSTAGWFGGRSTPTNGSGLAVSDDDGVDCDACHTITNPDNTEHLGVMNAPFIANCSGDFIAPTGTCESTGEGYYGSGMLSLWDGGDKLGPYAETTARHQFMQSRFHRDVDYCGSCHDVSNPAVGDLAPNHGTQVTAPAVISSGGNLGGPVADKAAFNNPPYAYGVVERTFSEYKASAFPTTRVGNFNDLPADLKAGGGSLDVTYQAAMVAASEAEEHGGIAGDYADGTPRFFSCQSCHMRPVKSAGANKNDAEVREDLPSHDHTGGNYWFADITKFQDSKGTLRLGGGLTAAQNEALGQGQQRAIEHLQQAASLQVSGNTLKVVNLTGHKLISGYPEGRRMWVNIKWYDNDDALLREDGAYGPIGATVSNPSGGPDINVESILDLDGANTRIYEAHYSVTKAWATTIEALHGPDFALNYDRFTGNVVCTAGDLLLDDAAPGKKEACKGGHVDTFHFTLNNYVSMDNRIPPYGMRYDVARKRNTLPVPADQYGGSGSGSIYNYWDEISLNPPANARHARIELLYQGTSWEYIQFLNLANDQQNEFLGQEGINMLDAWLNATTEMDPLKRTMVAPVVMATADWVGSPINHPPICSIDAPTDNVEIQVADSISYSGTASDSDGTIASYDWNFAGGNPAFANVEDPGQVDFSEAGVYLTTFTATDNSGASCDPASITVTVLEPNTYTIGGSVSELTGTGLILQNNDGDDLTISTNGGFTFDTPLVDGSEYLVTVLTQPTGPSQTCSVTNGNDSLDGADITNVSVTCVTDTFTVGGVISGLAGSGLVLQNNAGEVLAIDSNGDFVFLVPLEDHMAYSVTVSTQPNNLSQTCNVTAGSGNLDGANITSVSVTCVTNTFTVGGSVSGLAGTGLILQNNAGDDLTINTDGDFTFDPALADGSDYVVTVLTQPTSPNQTCSVSNGSGSLDGTNITGVSVTCSSDTFTVGGNVSDLTGTGLVLQNNSRDDLVIGTDGGFTFDTALADASDYAVTVLTQPTSPSQTCSVTNGSGSLAGANITNVSVTCVTDTFTVGGGVSGLTGTGLVLQNNADDDLAINVDGDFTFDTALVDGSDYTVTVLTQPTGPSQTCSIANDSGTLNSFDITNITISCIDDSENIFSDGFEDQ